MEIGTQKRFYCNRCSGVTNHRLHAIHEHTDHELADEGTPNEQLIFWETTEERMWLCCGCDTGLLESAYTHDGLVDHDGQQIWDSMLSPKPKRGSLPQKKFAKLPSKLSSIYREVIEAYNSDINILCTIGIRALLEGICADKGITGRDLQKKIPKLTAFLPENIVDHLHELRFMGNYAAHELEPVSRDDLRLAIDIMEDILNFLYDLEYKTSQLKRPQRSNN